MGRTHWHRQNCRLCGKPEKDGGRVSATGLCYSCGNERMNDNLTALETQRGPFAAWWAYKLADAVWGASVDEAPERP